jgi:elongation factor P
MGYLYREGEAFVFMDRETFEQVPLPSALLGAYKAFLQEDADLEVEFLGERPVGCRTPAIVEARVRETAAVQHAHESSVWKEAVLDNGLRVQVPLFIAPGEAVRVDLRTLRYHDRARR